jgi:hypothetical protein
MQQWFGKTTTLISAARRTSSAEEEARTHARTVYFLSDFCPF